MQSGLKPGGTTCFLKFPFLLGVFCLRGPGGVQMQLRCLVWVSVWRWVREAPGPRGVVGTPASQAFTVCRHHACCCAAARGLGPAPEPSGPPSPLGSWVALDSVAVPSDGFSVRPGVFNFRAPIAPTPDALCAGGRVPLLHAWWAACLLCCFGPAPQPGQHRGEGPWNAGLDLCQRPGLWSLALQAVLTGTCIAHKPHKLQPAQLTTSDESGKRPDNVWA